MTPRSSDTAEIELSTLRNAQTPNEAVRMAIRLSEQGAGTAALSVALGRALDRLSKAGARSEGVLLADGAWLEYRLLAEASMGTPFRTEGGVDYLDLRSRELPKSLRGRFFARADGPNGEVYPLTAIWTEAGVRVSLDHPAYLDGRIELPTEAAFLRVEIYAREFRPFDYARRQPGSEDNLLLVASVLVPLPAN